ncbi:MAG: thioredoxin [Candidatus Levybacteria bacterium]|nr:thioredoxin [Candidatus Levybacteria bacterium]
MDYMADITDRTFEQEVLKSQLPTLVDFWAPWCAPCRIVSPVVEELGEEYEGKAKVVKLNVDDNPDTASRYNVMSIPTLIIFKNGQPVKTIIGAQPKENIRRAIDEAIGS